jgi:hypothetical protein
MSDRVIEIGGETFWDFGETDTDREYFRLLQTSPWSEDNAHRLAALQVLEDGHYTQWKALLDQQCRDPNSVTPQELAKAEERGPWGQEYLCLLNKWVRKTPEGKQAHEREWDDLVPARFVL